MTHRQSADIPMDATTWAEREYANRGQERTVSLLRQSSAAIRLDASVSVMILCADPVVAAGLSAVLHEHTDFQIVPTVEPGNGPSPADVVLADYEAAMYLAESAPQWAKHLMVFTNYDSEAKISRALEIGARGYLLHGVGLQELFEGIRCVRRGGVALSPLVTARVTSRITSETLTAREKAVLELLMLGLRNKAIARRLNLSVGTVKTHVKSILQKLEADSRTAAVITAQRRGLLP